MITRPTKSVGCDYPSTLSSKIIHTLPNYWTWFCIVVWSSQQEDIQQWILQCHLTIWNIISEIVWIYHNIYERSNTSFFLDLLVNYKIYWHDLWNWCMNLIKWYFDIECILLILLWITLDWLWYYMCIFIELK